MADNKFKFKIFNGADPDAQYAAVSTKDPMTFYLLANGKGYFGTTMLFGEGAVSLPTIVNDMLASGFTPTTGDTVSSIAVANYVADRIQSATQIKFFRNVVAHTITAEEIANTTTYQVPSGVEANEDGLLFTADNDDASGGEKYYFVSLKSYLTQQYVGSNGQIINITITDGTGSDTGKKVIGADINIPTTEKSLVKTASGLTVLKTNGTINDGDGTTGTAPSSDKLVTESDMVNYIKSALANVVTYSAESGSES